MLQFFVSHNVGDQRVLFGSVLSNDYRRMFYGPVAAQDLFDLGCLDTKPAKFYLPVRAPTKLDSPVG